MDIYIYIERERERREKKMGDFPSILMVGARRFENASQATHGYQNLGVSSNSMRYGIFLL